ncbi:MAG TPA: pyridoxal-phosphate dependent enzyme [Methylomirabilota bacterium]|nr:pyridoxal-phosphate dependent enzyme [Methylomirabilota bacterium]
MGRCRRVGGIARPGEGVRPVSILDAIGNTSIVRLHKVVPPRCAGILAKLEWENPTGSVKDRMADAVISRAEADGRLKPGGTVSSTRGAARGHRWPWSAPPGATACRSSAPMPSARRS